MFSNIGRKIKILAIVFTIIGMVASLIIASYFWSSVGTYPNNDTSNSRLILTGFAVLILGCLASWIGSFCLYGFGHIIETTDLIKQNQDYMIDALIKPAPAEDYLNGTTPHPSTVVSPASNYSWYVKAEGAFNDGKNDLPYTSLKSAIKVAKHLNHVVFSTSGTLVYPVDKIQYPLTTTKIIIDELEKAGYSPQIDSVLTNLHGGKPLSEITPSEHIRVLADIYQAILNEPEA